jgi:capsular polysaccharide biosynthesis protein
MPCRPPAVLPLAAMLGPGSDIDTRPTGEAVRVALSPLSVGRHMLERLAVHEEPDDSSWQEAEYMSVNPFVACFRDVSLHGPAGIVRTGAGVVAETLWQTDESAGYARRGDRIVLPPAQNTLRVAGPALSLLGGNYANLYHWTLEGLGRLAAADAAALEGCAALLVPAGGAAFVAAGLALAGLDRRWPLVVVAAGDVLRVEHLVVPWTMTGHHRPHPALAGYFAPMTEAALAVARWPDGPWPRRIYVDRRGSAERRLENEAALIEALAARDFVPVRLETLPLATQVALFAHAEAIVAPHGAGLTHLLHAAPGCRVIELHMDQWVSWCFRRLAAVCGLAYDCVVGREAPGPQPGWIHARRWKVSLTHVLAAIDHAPSA